MPEVRGPPGGGRGPPGQPAGELHLLPGSRPRRRRRGPRPPPSAPAPGRSRRSSSTRSCAGPTTSRNAGGPGTPPRRSGGRCRPGLESWCPCATRSPARWATRSFFALQVADYGMTVQEMTALLDDTLEATAPLYAGLHCWAKHALAARFKQPAPGLLPAHWLGNRWAQSWPGLVEGADLDPLFAGRSRRVHRPPGRGVLRVAGLSPAARHVLAEVRPLSRAAGARRPQEGRSCLRLAHRRRARRALAHERRAQPALVRHRPPRAGSHLLLPGLHPPGGPLLCCARAPTAPSTRRSASWPGWPASRPPTCGGSGSCAAARSPSRRAGCWRRPWTPSSSCRSPPAP